MARNNQKAKSQSPKKPNQGPNKQLSQSMKKNFNKSPGGGQHSQQKKPFQMAKGQTPGKAPAKPFQTPKQAMNFQSPNQTPKFQTPKSQPGKKVHTPHPMKKKPAESEDDEDEEESDDEGMESYDSIEDEESDGEVASNGVGSKKAPMLMMKGLAAKKGLPATAEESDDDEEDDEDEDEEDEDDSLEDEDDDEFETSGSGADLTPAKGQNAKALMVMGKPKQLAVQPGKMSQLAKGMMKPQAQEESDEDEEDDEDWEDEDEIDEDEEESDDEEVQVKGGQLQKKQQPNGGAAKQMLPAKAQAQQPMKPMKRAAPAEESDEDEDDDDDDDEDEESESEESDQDATPIKSAVGKGQQQASKKGQQSIIKKADAGAPPQKKLKTNEGAKAVVEKKAFATMPTKLDKTLENEVDARRRERDQRSLFIRFSTKLTDDEIKALSPDILFVKRKAPFATWGWVSFANEQLCDKNYKKLKSTKVGDKELIVDYCGEKSQSANTKQSPSDQRVDALRLYVGNMPRQTKTEDVKAVFPSAAFIFHKPIQTFAFVNFASPEAARQAFEKSKNVSINGAKVTVAYARITKNKDKESPKENPVKKFAKKQQATG